MPQRALVVFEWSAEEVDRPFVALGGRVAQGRYTGALLHPFRGKTARQLWDKVATLAHAGRFSANGASGGLEVPVDPVIYDGVAEDLVAVVALDERLAVGVELDSSHRWSRDPREF